MRLVRILALVAVAGCGGAETAPTNPTTQPSATPVAASATAPAPSATATQPPQPTAQAFAPAPSVPFPADLPRLADVDTPASVAQKYGGAVVPVATRVRALKELDQKWSKDFASLPRADREKAAVAWLSARPEIEATGVSATGVWARFKDGKMIVAPTYDWPKPARHHAERETLRDSMNAKADIPQSKSRSIPDWFGYDTNANIASWLGDHGYSDGGGSDLTVTSLRTKIKNVGVLYMNTHGSLGAERDLGQAHGARNFNDVYSLLTATPVVDSSGKPITNNSASGAQINDTHNDAALEDDLAHGRLVYFYAPTGDAKNPAQWNYGFTFRFVAKYFSFSDESFVFLNACESASPDAALMTAAFKSAHASLIAGWDHEVSPPTAMRAAEFVFDRLLGANKMSNWGLHADKPKQRPWNAANTFGDLQSKGYDHETNPKGEPCALKYVGDTEIALVPIIDKMEADDVKHELTLHGTFGDDAPDRHVKIGGADCPVKKWEATEVTCDLGNDFKVGDVVADKKGRKSNPSPLTGWKLKVKYKLDMPQGFAIGLGFDAHVRADVHKVRTTPSDAPQARDPVPFYGAPDSQCGSADDKGSFSANGGHAWMTKGTTVPINQSRPAGDFCIMYGQVDPQGGKLKLAIMALLQKGAGTFNVTAPRYSHAFGMGLGVVPAPGLFDGSLPPPPGLPPQATMPTAIFFSMDDQGHVAGGNKGPVNLGNSGKAKVSLEWDNADVIDYPTDETPQ